MAAAQKAESGQHSVTSLDLDSELSGISICSQEFLTEASWGRWNKLSAGRHPVVRRCW